MIDYLLDNFNRVFGDERYAKWRRVIGAFHLKYPGVYVDTGRLTKNAKNYRVPGSFLVWRIGINHPTSVFFSNSEYSSTPGTYVVQLFPGSFTASFEWGRLSKLETGIYADDVKSAGDRTVITGFADFAYDGEIGELTKFYHYQFYDMVLREDVQRYRDMSSRIKRLI